MNDKKHLRQVIDQQQRLLGKDVPPDRQAATLALLRTRDRLPHTTGMEPLPDPVTGRLLTDLGGNKALRFCLEFTGGDAKGVLASSGNGLECWGERFLRAYDQLAEAELVLAHCETGFMRIVDDGNGRFDAWIAAKRPPPSWREREDFDWWALWLARRHESELRGLRSGAERSDPGHDALYRRLANVHLKMMAYQLGYPPKAVIGGCTVQTYRDVLDRLIGWALGARDRGEAVATRFERSLIAKIASDLAVDPTIIGRAVAAFTLDRENAAYHAAVPGVAAAPLVRVAPDQLGLSLHGLTAEPLLFLARELRRRDAQEYHNAAYLREVVFRQDLYTLFQDRRFVTSAGRIELRRNDGGIRTDIDAVIFDRKTGTLGTFELKSQDPFARSPAELSRRRDNVLYANRQISGVLDWLKRHGADELLSRVDTRTAKTFRVQKVYPFVLGRYSFISATAHSRTGGPPGALGRRFCACSMESLSVRRTPTLSPRSSPG